MKTPHSLSPLLRVGILLLIFTAMPAHEGRGDSPFKRALGAIKGRVEHVFQKIRSIGDEDPVSPTQPVTQERNPEYGPPPTTTYPPTPGRPSPSFNPAGPNGSQENAAPSVAGQPAIIFNKPQSATSSGDPLLQQQKVDANNRPALRDLPLNDNPRPPASPEAKASSSETQIQYAKPVPGHPGFVYPPGVTEELKNMLDVRGCASGEKMRDPRNGNIFLVP